MAVSLSDGLPEFQTTAVAAKEGQRRVAQDAMAIQPDQDDQDPLN